MDPITVFVAHASVEEATDQNLALGRLRESLNPVVQSYETTYDRSYGGYDAIIVLSGWDALAINKLTFIRLFGHVSAFDVKVKVFANEATSASCFRFFGISPTAACAILTGELEPTEGTSPDDDTQLFVSTIGIISSDMYLRNQSEEKIQHMLTEQEERNDHRGWSRSRE
ncbi:hypothetical protein N7463_003879 [Penicillium fimorum]|uniref:Uncharacterized protein n=1 Tax=Penicillium fimorum TaxID=1882269 RepID=A0A9W9Y1W0_9EURO|nr:hypothetical protein N7463_003879 [Penicillium fimorum]